MRLDGTEDLRVRKTIGAIRRAFEELVCETDYPHITVKALCERARINKKTFYRYYPTLDDLLVELQEDLSTEYLARIEGLRIPDDLEAITRAFFDFSCAQGRAYERITCSVAYRDVSAEMQERVMGSQGSAPEIPALAGDGEGGLFMTFVTESTLALYRRWVQGGKPVSPERLSDIAVALVCGGASRLLEGNRLADSSPNHDAHRPAGTIKRTTSRRSRPSP